MASTTTKSQQDIDDEEKYGVIPEVGEVCVYGEVSSASYDGLRGHFSTCLPNF